LIFLLIIDTLQFYLKKLILIYELDSIIYKLDSIIYKLDSILETI